MMGSAMQDIWELAEPNSLQISQRYIEGDEHREQKMVDLI